MKLTPVALLGAALTVAAAAVEAPALVGADATSDRPAPVRLKVFDGAHDQIPPEVMSSSLAGAFDADSPARQLGRINGLQYYAIEGPRYDCLVHVYGRGREAAVGGTCSNRRSLAESPMAAGTPTHTPGEYSLVGLVANGYTRVTSIGSTRPVETNVWQARLSHRRLQIAFAGPHVPRTQISLAGIKPH